MGKQPVLATKKGKEAISKAASSSSKSKKKWSKGKVKDRLQLAIFFDQVTYDKLLADIPKMKVITVSTVSDKLKVGGSMARKGIRHLQQKGLIKLVAFHHSQYIFTAAKEQKVEAIVVEEKAAGKQQKGKKGGKVEKEAAAQ